MGQILQLKKVKKPQLSGIQIGGAALFSEKVIYGLQAEVARLNDVNRNLILEIERLKAKRLFPWMK